MVGVAFTMLPYLGIEPQKINAKQDLQFELTHRARVGPGNVEGDVRGGVMPFGNVGGLPAKHLLVVWKIISIQNEAVQKMFPPAAKDGELLSKDKMELSRFDDISPDVIKKVNYSSGLDLLGKQIFLVVVWAYDGKGIKGYNINDIHFLWNVYNQPVAWVLSSIISAGEMKVINKTKEDLRKIIETAENLKE